jgi:hypothetical protein
MTSPPTSSVLEWLNAQDTLALFLTSITIAVIGFGLRVMPMGKRRQLLQERFEQFVTTAFDSRILSFDEPALECTVKLKATERKSVVPCQI